MKSDAFGNVFMQVIHACRNTLDDYDQRYNRMKRKNKSLLFLFRLGESGLIIYCFLKSFRPSTVEIYRNIILDDHASGVIKRALERSGYLNVDKQKKTVHISKIKALTGFFNLIKKVLVSYRSAKPDNVVEFARCAMIARYAMDYYGFLKKEKIRSIFIADTNDHKRLALGVIADIFDIPVFVFSVVKSIIREKSPFPVDTYFCWTKEQSEYLSNNTQAKTIIMHSKIIADIKVPVKKEASVGLLLSAKYDEKKIRDFINKLKGDYGLASIQIRPHPGKNHFNINFENGFVRDCNEPLNQYLESIDCVFAPNTNSMIESLLNGTPVVYVHDLGEGLFDLLSLVSGRLVIPFDEKFSFPDSINSFYTSDETKTALKIFYSSYIQMNSPEKEAICSILN